VPSIHFCERQIVNSVGSWQTKEMRRDVSILRQWMADFNPSRKPVFHPTIGREGETAIL